MSGITGRAFINGEFLPAEELRRQLEVNVVGQLRVTQLAVPALREARGRIVNIGSISGRSALPFLGPYAMSKFALEAMTDSLRIELRPWSGPTRRRRASPSTASDSLPSARSR